jgi:hypothetical protein
MKHEIFSTRKDAGSAKEEQKRDDFHFETKGFVPSNEQAESAKQREKERERESIKKGDDESE